TDEDSIEGRRAGRCLRDRTHLGHEEEPAERGRRRLRRVGAGPWHAGRNPAQGPLQRGNAVDPGIPQGHGDRQSACARYVSSASLDPDKKPKSLVLEEAKALHDAMQSAKLMSPPTDCLSPIGERLIKRGLKNVLGNLRPEFYAPPLTRDPAVYSGNPFQVEVGIVYGGDLLPDQPIEVLRFANRVPLLYQAGGCALTQAVANVDWRRYGLEQRGG